MDIKSEFTTEHIKKKKMVALKYDITPIATGKGPTFVNFKSYDKSFTVMFL